VGAKSPKSWMREVVWAWTERMPHSSLQTKIKSGKLYYPLLRYCETCKELVILLHAKAMAALGNFSRMFNVHYKSVTSRLLANILPK
jgi:hypothetical protein